MNNFKRGMDPKDSLDIGVNRSGIPAPGQIFAVHFRLRTSHPRYYPLQRMEKAGRSIIAIACNQIAPREINPLVACKIKGVPGEYFCASLDSSGKWEIISDWD